MKKKPKTRHKSKLKAHTHMRAIIHVQRQRFLGSLKVCNGGTLCGTTSTSRKLFRSFLAVSDYTVASTRSTYPRRH